jgi:uncharacterized protein
VATTTTEIPGKKSATPDEPATPERKWRIPWRPWLRALHRDFGYFVVGLTFIYALSGLAVNHIADWDPNFIETERVHHVPAPLPDDDDQAAAAIAAALHLTGKPKEVYRLTDEELEVRYEASTYTANLQTGEIQERTRTARRGLRVANWLHLNRGKKAWTYVADSYAVLLLFLATSGLFMLPGRKGLIGRGGILLVLGTAVPVIYVLLSGGP